MTKIPKTKRWKHGMNKTIITIHRVYKLEPIWTISFHIHLLIYNYFNFLFLSGLWPKDEGVESFHRCALECKKDLACTAFDVSPSDKKDLFQCYHFGHDKVTATNSVSLRGRCYKMKGRKAIRNARPKATFDGPQDGQQGGHKLLGEGNYKIISDKFSKWGKFF